MAGLIRGALPEHEKGPPVYDVEAPTKDETYDVTILSEYVLGVWCHWILDPETKKGHSERCYKDEGACPHCGPHRRYWLGFVAVFRHECRKKIVLRISTETVKALSVAVGRSQRIRGRRFWVKRTKASGTAALLWGHHKSEPLTPLPDCPSIKASVCQVLRCEDVPDYEFRPQEITEHPDDDGQAGDSGAPASGLV